MILICWNYLAAGTMVGFKNRKSQELSYFIRSYSGALQRKPGLHSHGLCFPDRTVPNSWLMLIMILVSVGFTWLKLFFLKVFSLQFWAGWSFLAARLYSWFLQSCLCSLCWLKAQTVLHHHQGNSGLPGKPLLPRGVYDVGSWHRVLVTEQPMALLKLQLWGGERPHSCPGLYPRGWIPVTNVEKALWIQDWGTAGLLELLKSCWWEVWTLL